jgi:hypothetical protein
MAMEFIFYGDDYNGLRVDFWPVQAFVRDDNVYYGLLQRHSTTIRDYKAIFDIDSIPVFAIRMSTARSVFLRSGIRGLDSGTVDETTGDFTSAYIVIGPRVVERAPDLLNDLLPDLPITTNDDHGNTELRVNTLNLSINNSLLNVAGKATYLQIPLGGDVRFSYSFRLKPYLDVLNTDRILDVETIEADVRSAAGGPLGFLINIFSDFLIWVFKRYIIDSIENSIQEEMDTAIREMLADEGAVEGATASVLSVVIDESNGIVVRAYAAVDGRTTCAGVPTSGSIRARSKDQLQRLRAMREKVMKNTPRGEAYLRMLRRHNAELVYLLTTHPDLLKQMDLVIDTGLKDFTLARPDEGVMSMTTAREAIQLLRMVTEVASSDLSVLLRGLIPEIKELVGTPVSGIFLKRHT